MTGKKVAVTGANGFVGAHCVLELLQHGYTVVAVVRDATNGNKTQFLVEEATRRFGPDVKLSFASGDLLEVGSYDTAFQECWGVVHTATVLPDYEHHAMPATIEQQYEGIVKPAVDGTNNVVASIKKHSKTIQRFVNMSSLAAILSNNKPTGYKFTEDDWNTYSTVENGDAYGYAKAKAEQSIWDDKELCSMVDVIVSLNPSIILGTVYTKAHASLGSCTVIYNMMKGEKLMCDGIKYPLVHIRDVLQGVMCALTQDSKVVNGKRFILDNSSFPPMTMSEIYTHVQKHNTTTSVTTTTAPPEFIISDSMFGVYLWIGRNIPFLRKSLKYNQSVDAYAWKDFYFDNTQSKTILGLGSGENASYRSIDVMIKDTVESMQPYL